MKFTILVLNAWAFGTEPSFAFSYDSVAMLKEMAVKIIAEFT